MACSGTSATRQTLRISADGDFAGIGLILVIIGVYSVIAYTTARRTHEIDIRMALGVQPQNILRLIVGQGDRMALFGIALGPIASFALTRLMVSMLVEVSRTIR